MNNVNIRKYPMNLQLFAEDPTDPPVEPIDPDEPPKTFTQDELDRVVAERVARERKKAEKYANYDELQTKLTALEEAEEARKKADMSDAERLESEKEEALKKAQEAEERSTARETAANQRIINAEFKALARDNNVPADRIAAALKLADLSGVTVDDEGNPQGIEDAVKALVEANPYLVEVAKPKSIGGAAGGELLPDRTKEQLLTEAADKARKTGRIEDRMAYSALKDELAK